mmetsp:Transcript_10097/g.29042  ORF Transcript_10097/g.29042 Transcript_10097/m.29042 type:complete len:219 (-) Transcript_10097:645-1301(-)
MVIETAKPLLRKTCMASARGWRVMLHTMKGAEFAQNSNSCGRVVFGSNCGCASIKEVNFSFLMKYSTSALVAFASFFLIGVLPLPLVLFLSFLFTGASFSPFSFSSPIPPSPSSLPFSNSSSHFLFAFANSLKLVVMIVLLSSSVKFICLIVSIELGCSPTYPAHVMPLPPILVAAAPKITPPQSSTISGCEFAITFPKFIINPNISNLKLFVICGDL